MLLAIDCRDFKFGYVLVQTLGFKRGQMEKSNKYKPGEYSSNSGFGKTNCNVSAINVWVKTL